MTSTMEAGAGVTTTSEGGAAIFKIDSAQTTALFSLGEELMGNPKIVTGTTTSVSGVITVDQGTPANSSVGVIQVDATGFQTDSNMRDRAIRQFILQSQDSKFQYITFEPTAIEGLPSTIAVGTEYTFKVTGNLKVLEVSKSVTFDVVATLKSDTELVGSAKTVVTHSDFGVTIPQVPSVANVTPEVTLELHFVATKQ